MALKIIVSYDDTDNDRDALALGRLLAFSGAELSLAYVRHSFGESLDQHAAEELLARGAESVGTPDMPKYVVINPATSVGLAELAEQEDADVIVFGSEYRTANGLVKPGISAHKLLLGGGSAIAVAPAGLRSNPALSVNTVGVIDEGDAGARQTAESLAGRSARPSPSTARARSTSWSSARARRPRRAKSSSAPPATTRSRRRTTRCWSSRAAPSAATPRPSPFRWTTRITAATDGSRPSIRSRACSSDTVSVSWPETMSASVCTGESEWMTSVAGPRWARRPSVAASSTVAVTSVAERSAFAQPWLKARSWIESSGPFEDPQPRSSSRRPFAVAEQDRAVGEPGVEHGAAQLLLGEVEGAGVAPAGGDFDVEGHRGRDATGFRRRRVGRRVDMMRAMPPLNDPTRSSSTTTACCSTPSRSGPAPRPTSSSATAPSSPPSTSASWSAPPPRSPAA